MIKTGLLVPSLLCLSLASHGTSANDITEFTGSIDLDHRSFLHDPIPSSTTDQHNNYSSIAATPELYHSWNNQDDSITVTLFGRYDQHDKERRHVDLRELNWLHVGDGWQVRSGVGKVFWGSIESQHLVDIINQTDNLEGIDGEAKLGQPMVNYSYLLDQGEISLFWLPYFRERDFAGTEGRPTTPLPVDTDNPQYSSSDKQNHQDFAVRINYSFDDMDVALSHFSGTSREPTLTPNSSDPSTATALIATYELIDQTGLELTSAQGDWLWKLEAIYNTGLEAGSYSAVGGGFEYTFVGLFDSDLDLGSLLEYHYDDRDQQATSPFQDDLFFGLRLTFNDFQSTELLTGVIWDRDTDAQTGFIEASRRLGSQFKLSLEARLFDQIPSSDPLYYLRDDDFVELSLQYFF